MRVLNKQAQSTLEYAIIVAVVVGALLAMQIYVKRGVQGRLRSSTDNIGDQYSAGNITAKYTTTAEQSVTKETVGYTTVGKGVTRSEVTTAGTTTRAATGDVDAEKITVDLTGEDLFDEPAELFDTD